MSQIVSMPLSEIDKNPLRDLKAYPYNEKKIEALMHSIADVGLWEGVIVRNVGNRHQCAFGHHRLEAAKRQLGKDAEVFVVLRDLTDEQMIQFMGRENMEDYNSNFLVMLESWEAGAKFLRGRGREDAQMIDIASLLGWTEGSSRPNDETVRSNATARACYDASRLIAGGYISKDELVDLAVKSVREIVARVVAQQELLEKMAKITKRPAAEVERFKKMSGRAGALVAKNVREGRTAAKDIYGEVNLHSFLKTKTAERASPLFAVFGKGLVEQISKIANSDSIAEKFNEIKSSIGMLTLEEDVHVVKQLAFECESAADRFDGWAKTFTNPKRKVVKLKEISHD